MYASKIRLLTLTALFAALIFLLTAYLHIPSANGYTHIGDAFVYLAGALLPPGYAAAAGAIGAALADLMTGYAFWAPASILIKALTACLFTAKASKILNCAICLRWCRLLCFALADIIFTKRFGCKIWSHRWRGFPATAHRWCSAASSMLRLAARSII